ncbi:helix-turn-helix domain-containing protein [Niveibacterium sp. 24ML]|uniref:helix-turn-helix domain-containing protein n=1 Tax=Niveibacterium sp. 24ML TaxID=2985512 RepID=UPI0022714B96|nr:helix-turn-helix domain-containing protein [Niveibacterium sp. 24ML]MCX9158056.1 helix-turn-helix domain-containing protein [Niveibacterium sp. 24ML]
MTPKVTALACPQLVLTKGASVDYLGQEYVITSVSTLESVIARNLSTGMLEALQVGRVRPWLGGEKQAAAQDRDLDAVSKDAWDEAKRRLSIIQPLVGRYEHGARLADALAREHGLSVPTLYRWRNLYLGSGLLSSLLPTKRSGGRGKSRISDPRIEEALRHTVEDYYMTDECNSLVAAWEHLDELCRQQEIETPHLNTLRTRVAWRSARSVFAARKGNRAASMRFDPIEGSVPDAEWPLAMVQVDHTELPVIIVDDTTRRPINRPWVTFGIDVYSRMVLGMYLSLDPPSAMSAGICISHAILDKDQWLADRHIDAQWPCWGVMGTLHMDNAREFRGNMLLAACEEYSIDLMLRPVKTPHYGGHIERLMGTVSEGLKTIPGKTFSGPTQKGEYDSEGKAVMTLAELERWLAFFLAKYHNELHRGIGTSPIQKYREGLLGTKGRPGRGLPARRLDAEKVRIDFMPFDYRVIHGFGVVWDDIVYFHDVLRPWVHVTNPSDPQRTQKYRFRRDPRDISELYFFDPDAKRYFAIPYRNLAQPAISLWEAREAKKQARVDGIKHIDEETIFRYARKMREQVAVSAELTKAARKKNQRAIEHAKAKLRKAKELPRVASKTPIPTLPPAVRGYDPSEITPYDDD